jgi:hypothetical protein
MYVISGKCKKAKSLRTLKQENKHYRQIALFHMKKKKKKKERKKEQKKKVKIHVMRDIY